MAKKKLEKVQKSLAKGFQKIDITELHQCTWNYKKFNDSALQAKLVANIEKNGQIENLITYEDEHGQIIIANGNHRYLALQELQFTHAECYHLGKMTEAQAKRIAVETNETKFETDKNKLAELVDTLVGAFEDFDETNPFDEKEMNVFANMLKDDEILVDDETPKKPAKSKTMVSGGGEKYTTVKLELSPDLSDRFNNALAKFSFLEGTEKPLDIIVQLVEKYTAEEILEITDNKPKRSKALKRIK